MLGFLSQMQRRVWRLAVRGYSLPEMAIALLVLGILLGGIVVPLSSRLKAEARLKTENLIYDAREAVLGYGIANRTVSGVGGVPIQVHGLQRPAACDAGGAAVFAVSGCYRRRGGRPVLWLLLHF